MRSVVLEQFGEPVAVRQAEQPADGLLVRVQYGGVCGTDVHLQAGRLPIQVPIVLGHEGVGRVEAVAPGFERDAPGAPLNVGDRVAWASSIACGRCFYCRDAQEPTLCERRSVYGITRSVGGAIVE